MFLLLISNWRERKITHRHFKELLLLIRTEEDKHAVKLTRMKKHLGVSKPKEQSTIQSARAYYQEATTTDDSSSTKKELSLEAASLKKQIAELKVQLAALQSTKQKGTKPGKAKSAGRNTVQTSAPEMADVQPERRQDGDQAQKPKPRPWYCF